MINVRCDAEHSAVIVEFDGAVDAAQAERAYSHLEKLLPRDGRGFTVLVDFSAVETMDPEVEVAVKKAMELGSARGVREIIRVLPESADFGFNLLSARYFSTPVSIRSVRTREEARALLRAARR